MQCNAIMHEARKLGKVMHTPIMLLERNQVQKLDDVKTLDIPASIAERPDNSLDILPDKFIYMRSVTTGTN